jgi:hypothetical protein
VKSHFHNGDDSNCDLQGHAMAQSHWQLLTSGAICCPHIHFYPKSRCSQNICKHPHTTWCHSTKDHDINRTHLIVSLMLNYKRMVLLKCSTVRTANSTVHCSHVHNFTTESSGFKKCIDPFRVWTQNYGLFTDTSFDHAKKTF